MKNGRNSFDPMRRYAHRVASMAVVSNGLGIIPCEGTSMDFPENIRNNALLPGFIASGLFKVCNRCDACLRRVLTLYSSQRADLNDPMSLILPPAGALNTMPVNNAPLVNAPIDDTQMVDIPMVDATTAAIMDEFLV